MRKEFILIAFLLSIIPNTSFAGTCEEAVLSFAEKHNLSVEAPAASLKGDQVTIPNTAKTDGLIRPPGVDSKAVITPPEIGANMPPAPRIDRNAPTGRKPTPGQRIRAEALLLAARATSRQGDEKACYAKLNRAQQILVPQQSERQG